MDDLAKHNPNPKGYFTLAHDWHAFYVLYCKFICFSTFLYFYVFKLLNVLHILYVFELQQPHSKLADKSTEAKYDGRDNGMHFKTSQWAQPLTHHKTIVHSEKTVI